MILIVSDIDYFKKSSTLIKSIKLQYPDIKIHYHQINFKVNLDFNNIEYSYSNLELNNEVKYKYNNLVYTQKQAYCANIRFQIIKNLIEKNKFILYLDADSIVRKPLTQLLQLCESHDLVINKCTQKKYYRKGFRIRTGIFSIKNTPIMIEFMDHCINNLNLYQWFSDQDTIQDTFIEFNDKISFKSLPTEYIDWKYDLNSIIWVGKGDNKIKNNIYINEEERINNL